MPRGAPKASDVTDPLASNVERFSFGDSPAMADELLALVLAGRKTATCWAARDFGPTLVGAWSIILDGAGRSAAVIEATEMRLLRFKDVDEAFARDEGEGDRTLTWWRDAHRRYFERNGGFSDDMELWCERFRVVEVLAAIRAQD